MSAQRKSLDLPGAALMIALCLCWGFQQVAVKAAAPGLHPVMQMALRSTISAVLVAGLMALRGGGFSLRDGTFWPGLAAGALFAAEFLCIALGLTFTTASHMVVFLYTAPVFTVLGLQWLVPGERLQAQQWLGIALAFAGIAAAFSQGLQDRSGPWLNTLTGDALGMLAGLLWAATTIVIRATRLSEAPPAKTLLYQLAVSALILLAIAGGNERTSAISMSAIAWASLIFQAVVVSFASYLAWFWVLRRYLASRVSVFSFLTPLFGVGFGVGLLQESVGARFGIGAGLVVLGILMVNFRRG